MSGYLLDTSTCIALIDMRPAAVRERLGEARATGAPVRIPTVALFELAYGLARSAPGRREANARRLETFVAGPLDLLDFGREDARAAGEIRQHLRAAGTPIGAYDLLIAGQALCRGMTVVTSNLREFLRVPGLRCEDWAA